MTTYSDILNDQATRIQLLTEVVHLLCDNTAESLEFAETIVNHNGLHVNWKSVRVALNMPVDDGTHSGEVCCMTLV